jgi:TldD protein
VSVELIDAVRPRLRDVVGDASRRLAHVRYADVRFGVTEARFADAENGSNRSARADYAVGLGVRVLAGERAIAPGYVGLELGAAELPRLPAIVADALAQACRRAIVNAAMKADAREKFRPLGDSLVDTPLHHVPACEDTVPAAYEIDPRAVTLARMTELARDVSRRVAARDAALKYNYVSVLTQLSRHLFVSTEGAAIDEAFALTQGTCGVVAVHDGVRQQLWDALGHQRGWEILERGVDEPFIRFPTFVDFALALAADAVELARAPVLPTTGRDVVVVTDPHYNALVVHEIVGHPVELDRALKMETAYAGRSWLLRDLDTHQVGKRVASPLVTAYSDPSLPGYGHYRYDHEGTPGRRVVHIDRGMFTGFMNSRQTAAVFAGAPNGHYVATAPHLVPLIRMSNTVFAAGDRDPREIVADVEHGYYVAGHRIPSIAESRENFRISARKVYEIDHGRLGRLYRNGGIAADSRDYLMNVDAVGFDFRLYPIPNCGKGQPMQTKKLGNGGPTMRSRARLVGES